MSKLSLTLQPKARHHAARQAQVQAKEKRKRPDVIRPDSGSYQISSCASSTSHEGHDIPDSQSGQYSVAESQLAPMYHTLGDGKARWV